MQNTFGHVQSHSGGFFEGGQAGQWHLLGGDDEMIGFRGHEQLHSGGHFGQWQTTLFLPLVLADGLIGQEQSHFCGGFFASTLYGTMNATQITALKITEIFMITAIFSSSLPFFELKSYEVLKSLIALHTIQQSFIQFFLLL